MCPAGRVEESVADAVFGIELSVGIGAVGLLEGNVSLNTGAGDDEVILDELGPDAIPQITGDGSIDGGGGNFDELLFMDAFNLDAILGALSIDGFELLEE